MNIQNTTKSYWKGTVAAGSYD